MTDVFISYAREDRSEAADLARLLEERGYTVWWDWNLVGGSQFRDVIASELANSRKVIVLWSARSIGSSFVIDEAQEAKDRRKLIPISIDGSSPPMGFRDIHTLYVRKFHEVADIIVASLENRSPMHKMLAKRRVRPEVFYIAGFSAICLVVASIWMTTLALTHSQPPYSLASTSEVVYADYSSPELGVTVIYPHSMLSLDDMARKQRRLVLRDGDGHPVVTISRRPLDERANIEADRQHELDDLKRMNRTLTYVKPDDRPLTNWYVLSGIGYGAIFYYRRWYCEDSVVSIEFVYPQERAPLFDKIIPPMTKRFEFSCPAPKN